MGSSAERSCTIKKKASLLLQNGHVVCAPGQEDTLGKSRTSGGGEGCACRQLHEEINQLGPNL